ncbi:MAG: hypothetical protein AB7T48_00780 [Solirubrobacterales bacterium]
MVSLPRTQFIALVVGVCIISAAIGTGVALLAQTGPAGPAGKQGATGPRGPEGPEGPSGAAEVEGVEIELEELRGEIEGGSDVGELESRVEELEEEVAGLGGVTSELCSELDFFC